MIEETGRVIAIEKGMAEVETVRTSSCTSCRARHGCGHHAVAQLSSSNRMRLRVQDPFGVELQQEVIVGIPEHSLLLASVWMYLMPLIGLLLGATLPTLLTSTPIWSVLFSVLGFVSGLAYARQQAKHVAHRPEFMPRILRVSSVDVKTVERSKISIYQHP